MKKKFELTLTKNYASAWEIQEALREIVQNAIDQEKQVEGNTMSIEYDGRNVLKISNKSSILSKKSLLLGFTSKADDENAIGQFGEGYKIALLVLNRLGKKVTINNYGNREVWTSKFVKSRRYEGEEVLTIYVETEAIWKKTPNNNLTIEVEGVSKEDYKVLKERTLFLKENVGEVLDGNGYGTILLNESEKGRVYVNGLYINTIDELRYGYDIKPAYLKIGRDRDLVSDFDIVNITSNMWKLNNSPLLHELIKDGCKDVYYLSSKLAYSIEKETLEIQDTAYELFKEEYGNNAIPVSSQSEFERVNNQYENAKPVIVNSSQKEIVIGSSEYKKKIKDALITRDITIEEAFFNWKEANRYGITDDALKSLEEVLSRVIDMDKVEEIEIERERERHINEQNIF